MSKVFGLVATALGAIGSVLSIAAAVAALLFIAGANNVVDDVADRVTEPVARLGGQIQEASEAVVTVDGGELGVRLEGIADQAASATTAADVITEHPLYSVLPVDTESLENRLASVAAVAGEVGESQVDDLSAADRSTISSSLDELAGVVGSVDSVVEEATYSLRFWIRLSGLVFVALALWSLWAQVMLFRHGRQRSR